MSLKNVQRTQTGLFVRDDANLGLLVYSPYTGLLFSCIENGAAKTNLVRWLWGDTKQAPSKEYQRAIGAGWMDALGASKFPLRQRLSTTNLSPKIAKPAFPLLINWLLTGRCAFHCTYCYSTDVMRQASDEPTQAQVKRMAKTILSYRPVSVVLTGGDPLVSPNVVVALAALTGKAGVIVDTNGFGLTGEHLRLFREHDVYVRVSIDSESARTSNELRPPNDSSTCSLNTALDCLDRCMRNHVRVGVQTVVTKENSSDLMSLGYRLRKLGISSWRLQIIANHTSFAPSKYQALRPNMERFHRNIIQDLRSRNKTVWDEGMCIQVVDNQVPNAVVLVLPDGQFCTELPGAGKVPIDPRNPCRPSNSAMSAGALNLDAHADRYLNLIEASAERTTGSDKHGT
jgi:sulfatase maturation enzyme AslB (radical SAM superfamily)